MTDPIRHHVEYRLLQAVGAVVRALPYRGALSFGAALAAVSFPCARGRRHAAGRRIREVFGPGVARSEVRRMAWRSWLNMFFSGVEMLRMPKARPPWVYTVMAGDELLSVLTERVRTRRGAIVALPHMGAWELAAVFVRTHDVPLFTIAADQRNQRVSRYINNLRAASGMDVLVRGRGAARETVRRLRRGDILAVLPDLRQRTPGIVIPFLGGRANVAEGPAAMAHMAGVPILPCYVTRDGWTAHRIHALPAIRPHSAAKRADDVSRMTRELFAAMDRAIRRHPDQWFWYNKRWVLDPPP